MSKKALEVSDKVILVGDLNIDSSFKKNHNSFKLFQENNIYYYLPKYEYSTNGNTQIDIACSNFQGVDFCFYESYFSYHKPVIAKSNGINSDFETSQHKTIDNNNNVNTCVPMIIIQ